MNEPKPIEAQTRGGSCAPAPGSAADEDVELVAFEWFSMAHPHEAYETYPERFWLFFQTKCPGKTRAEMEKFLAETAEPPNDPSSPMTAPQKTIESPDGLAGQSLGAAPCSALPCPFCGSPCEYHDSSYPTQRRVWVSWWLLQCANPECAIWSSGATKDAARAKWNRRTSAREMLQTDWLEIHRENQRLREAMQEIIRIADAGEWELGATGKMLDMASFARQALSPNSIYWPVLAGPR